jgi:small-conductance mechanosensitive channel
LVERQIAAQQDEYRKAEEANRRAADEVARAKGSPGEAAALWRLDSSSIQLRSVGASLALYQAGIVTHQPRIAAAKAELALLKRQLAAIGDAVSFTDEDLEKAKASAAAKTAAIEKEVSSLAKHQASVLTERDRARTALEELRKQAESDPSQPNPASEAAEARLRAVEADAEALAFQTETLGFSIRVSGDVPDALTLRRQLLAPQDADQRLAARQQLQAMTERARAWVTFIANERAAVGAAIREQESRLVAIPDEDPRHPNEQRVLAAQLRKTECLERLDQLANVTLHSFERWLADDERHLRERPLGTWLADSSARLWGVARRVWGFEIYRYEDKVEVDGETITVKRGLTLGWLLGALLFFFTAYRAASWFSRRIQRTVVQHSLAGEAQARTLRRWAMLAVGVLLALITLHLLRIPVTAFAFLGGALAIGIGFGTQTFFKNFISGIIVLAERKVKVGDILDVDGVIGTVTAVDTRSSTIRSVDGMETLVPNSMLLENKVTNWTHTSARQRRVLRVGVAYGSPVQQVSEILAECAQRHGLVLDDPPPQVVFEDFGADSLVFALYFWVVLSERSSGNVVASDLRFMLDKRFAEAGIAIAYPQRDIHLNALAPLQVELVHGTKEPAAPEARPD